MDETNYGEDLRPGSSGRSSHHQRKIPRRYYSAFPIENARGQRPFGRTAFGLSPCACQRCWAHKARNVVNKVRKKDQKVVKADLHKITHAKNLRAALRAMTAFHKRWRGEYPAASDRLANDCEASLAFFRIKDAKLWKQARTTNAIERRFREVRRRSRPVGVFADSISMGRILYAVVTYENLNQGIATPIPLTQTS